MLFFAREIQGTFAPSRRENRRPTAMTEEGETTEPELMKPWEVCAEFEADLTLEMSDGSGSVRVNRIVLSTYSTLVRTVLANCDPESSEPIPIVGFSLAQVETLLRIMYQNVLPRDRYSVEYDIFAVVTQTWALANYMACEKILDDMRILMKIRVKDLVAKTSSYILVRTNIDKMFPAFDALVVIESSLSDNASPVWDDNELTILFRCVNYGGPAVTFSKDHVRRLRPQSVMQMLMIATYNHEMKCSESLWQPLLKVGRTH